MRRSAKYSFTFFLLALPLIAILCTSCQTAADAHLPHQLNVVDERKPAISNRTHADVVVIGSELEGVDLARAAVSEGLSVVILDPRAHPGGQLIQGRMYFLDKPQDLRGRSLLQGYMKQLFAQIKKGTIRKNADFKRYYNTLIQGIPIESGISIEHMNITRDPQDGKKKITSIQYVTKDHVEKTITAEYWVESSDFAALSSRLGLKQIPGINSVFGGTDKYMASSYMLNFKGVNWWEFEQTIHAMTRKEIVQKYGPSTMITNIATWGFGKVGSSYSPSSPELFLRGLNIYNQFNGDAVMNALLVYNVDPADPTSVQRAVQMGRNEAPGILQHLRNALPGWEHAALNGFPNYLYIRDYKRFETKYVLQASDLMSGRMFWDNVSIAGYPIDLQGTLDDKWGVAIGKPDKYGIPLRSFIPKGYSNVIFTGKNVGASAVAYGSARIQANTSLAAQVIGIMLAKCEQQHMNLSDISKGKMLELQKYIKKKYHITLTGVSAINEIKNFNAEQRKKLNQGKIQLEF